MQPLSNVSEREERTCSRRSRKLSNEPREPPRPAMGVYIAHPSKSNRYVQNCAITDCPLHKNRIVRYSNATARNAFNVCQRRPFEPWRTVRAPGADRPQLKVSHHQRQTTSLVQNSQRPADRPRARGGPSAVELSFPPETTHVSGTIWVRGADRPRPLGGPSALHFSAHTRGNSLSGTFPKWVADRPH